MSWRMQFFAPPSGPGYVKDGLILHLDGIWNAGVGIHDPAAQTWTDITGNGYDLPIGEGWTIGENYISRATAANINGTKPFPCDRVGGEYTFEALIDSGKDVGYSGISFGNTGKIGLHEFEEPSIWSSCMGFERYNSYYNVGFAFTAAQPFCVCLTVSARAGKSITYMNGVEVHEGGILGNDAPAPLLLRATSKTASSPSLFYAARAYSRILSPDEIRQNYEVDKERFHL